VTDGSFDAGRTVSLISGDPDDGARELETAIQAVKAGAFEYIVQQPGRINEEIKVAIKRALENGDVAPAESCAEARCRQPQLFRTDIGLAARHREVETDHPYGGAYGSTIVVTGESAPVKNWLRARPQLLATGGRGFRPINCVLFLKRFLERAVWLHEGRIYGAPKTNAGCSNWRWRHHLPGRDKRNECGHAGEASACVARA